MLILTAQEIRAAEARANEKGLSYETMMRRAGVGCAQAMLRRFPEARRYAVLCGKGKNGGDGYVIADTLRLAGREVTVIRVFDAPGDALSEKMRAALPGEIPQLPYADAPELCFDAMRAADAVVDAVFGIGFSGAFPPAVGRLIAFANSLLCRRIAVDVPSGLHLRGDPAGAFQAELTLSMLCYKYVHVIKPWQFACGETQVIPIGFAPEEEGAPFSCAAAEIAARLPHRPFNANKGTFGNTLILGGSRNMPGAAILAADGALHAGAGLVTLGLPDVCMPAAAAHLRECVFLPLKTDGNGQLSEENIPLLRRLLPRFSAIVAGNGMGTGAGPEAVLCFLLENAACPLILDADGINLAARHIDKLKTSAGARLLTPHPGEMSRLTGAPIDEICAEPESAAVRFAAENGVWLLLKGANTVVAPPAGGTYINPTGSTALSRGGSGDLLAGMVGAFASQGAAPFDALILAAYLHGLAGELAEARCTAYAATIEETLRSLPDAFVKIHESL